ncbi:glycosyltransferase family 39 protein [Parapedobacter koreensis]|uniref:Dolichyl-phosphate-mannose-protein mannosyltransferase n=1 Tax=Parapedobacter koreensis TaxID=332977 RepID=A0A1H7SJ58_9SPHI|nr:glycosyltransferase family 39 protein [Parapedobacter koreensis]SEL72563.1 Dolichyl-phosphate-mannose-protein mannosyltransferase [Parapedobacter koreensis]
MLKRINMTTEAALLAGFILAKFALQAILISPAYELHRDEYLHLDQANHLAWGYLSVPPLTSWISYLIKLLGNSVWWVKFFPALFGALTLVVVWKAVAALGGGLFARALAATGVLFSVLLRLNTLYQPNSVDVLCWTAFYYTVIRYIGTERPRWLFIGAVVLAIGFLNKYNIIFLVVGLLPAILLTTQRSVLSNRRFWAAMGLALLLISPNLIWQYRNGFPVVQHLGELADSQLVHVDRWGFLRAQLVFFLGSVVLILAGLYALLAYQPLRRYRLFFWSFFATLAVFIYFRAKDYYAIGLYPIYHAFGAVFLADVLDTGWKRLLRPVLLLLPLLFFIPMYRFAFPNRSPAYIMAHHDSYREIGLLRWEDGKDHDLPQDFADMLGWKELARKVDSAYAQVPDPTRTLVMCDNYGQAGAINYYSERGIRAVSFNADYINWMDLSQPYSHYIRVKSAWEVEDELEKTSPYFERANITGAINNRYAREYGTTVMVFTGAKIDINERLRAEVMEKKNASRR